jgi:hypothetical protein
MPQVSRARPLGSRLGEVALVLGLFLAAAWLAPLVPGGRRLVQSALGIAALLVIVGSVRRDGVPLSGLGLRVDNVLVAGVFVLALDALPLVAVAGLGGFREVDVREVLTYSGWALFQQFVVVAGFWRHLRPGTGPWRSWRSELEAAALAAGLFALVHAPNVALMGLVFGAELVWLVCFTRFRNLFALALAHSLAAIVVKHSLVPGWLPSMKVGLGYWRP